MGPRPRDRVGSALMSGDDHPPLRDLQDAPRQPAPRPGGVRARPAVGAPAGRPAAPAVDVRL